MIEVKFTMNPEKKLVSLHVKGHAGAKPYGYDTICSAASILAYTLAQNIKYADVRDALKYKPTIKLHEGNSIITCRAATDEDYSELLKIYLVIQTGYQLLAHNYPKFVALEMFGQAESA